MAKGNPPQEASGSNSTSAGVATTNQAASSSNPQTNQAPPNPPPVVTDNNCNLELNFAKEDKRNEYNYTVNQKETERASSNSNNTLVNHKGKSEDTKYGMVFNIGGKNAS